jgi:predicted nucleic acid-binding protein
VSGAPGSESPQSVVIDASMALAWLFERQQALDSARADRLLEACGEAPWWVPGLWHLEVANALLVAERRSVLPQAESDRFLARLNSLPIATDAEPTPERGVRTLALARAHALSSYDATYLELAQRLGAALASFDRQLNQAARVIGVPLFAES